MTAWNLATMTEQVRKSFDSTVGDVRLVEKGPTGVTGAIVSVSCQIPSAMDEEDAEAYAISSGAALATYATDKGLTVFSVLPRGKNAVTSTSTKGAVRGQRLTSREPGHVIAHFSVQGWPA